MALRLSSAGLNFLGKFQQNSNLQSSLARFGNHPSRGLHVRQTIGSNGCPILAKNVTCSNAFYKKGRGAQFGNFAQPTQIRFLSLTRSVSGNLNLSGILPPLATPFRDDESVDYDSIEANIKKWNVSPLSGYVVHGSNGEAALLSFEERVSIVKAVKEHARSDMLVLAGSGCESTRDTIAMSQEMAREGADALMVITPSVYPGQMTADALHAHYTKVADASPKPLVLYSVPANTGIDLPIDVIVRLSAHPNIIALKDSGGMVAKLAEVVHRTKDSGFQVLAGSASFLYPALVVGCVGGICGLGNVLPQECCDLVTLVSEGRHEEARTLQHRLVAPNNAVTRQLGVPGLKWAMEWYGYHAGPPRSPLLPATQTVADTVKSTFQKHGFSP